MMTIQDRVLLTYRSIVKRIYSWLLPLLILFLLGSAYGRTNSAALTYFSWIELNALHFYSGWVLCLVSLLIAYDFIFRRLSSRSQFDLFSPSYESREKVSSKLMGFINTVFYLLLFLICLSGLSQYGLEISSWQSFSVFNVEISLAHIAIGWLFISAALIKFYLTFTRWLGSLIFYLREE